MIYLLSNTMIFQGLKVENGLTTSLFGNSEMMNLNVFNSLLLEITPVSSYHELSPIVPFKFRGGFLIGQLLQWLHIHMVQR